MTMNVITKSRTNDLNGTAHFTFKNDSLSSKPKNPDGTTSPKFPSTQTQAGFTIGGPLQRDKLFYFGAFDYQKAKITKQTNPARIEQRVVDAFTALGSPAENGDIEHTNDARVLLLKADWNATQKNLANLRYNYTWSEQKNGTFDVDSWGTSANATEKDYSHAVTGSLISNVSSNVLNELRFQWAREYRPRPYVGPDIAGQSRPLPDTAFDFGRAYRFGEPFFDAALLDAKRPAEAESYLREALAIQPEFAAARASLGVALIGEGRTTEAIAEFQHSLRLEPNQPEVEFNLGIALVGLGRIDEAISHYSAAIRLRPGYGDALLNRGVSLAQLGRVEEALPDLEAAVGKAA